MNEWVGNEHFINLNSLALLALGHRQILIEARETLRAILLSLQFAGRQSFDRLPGPLCRRVCIVSFVGLFRRHRVLTCQPSPGGAPVGPRWPCTALGAQFVCFRLPVAVYMQFEVSSRLSSVRHSECLLVRTKSGSHTVSPHAQSWNCHASHHT